MQKSGEWPCLIYISILRISEKKFTKIKLEVKLGLPSPNSDLTINIEYAENSAAMNHGHSCLMDTNPYIWESLLALTKPSPPDSLFPSFFACQMPNCKSFGPIDMDFKRSIHLHSLMKYSPSKSTPALPLLTLVPAVLVVSFSMM